MLRFLVDLLAISVEFRRIFRYKNAEFAIIPL